ncbi:MAG TPA: MTH1187 family thiamine-binding protein [Armatimonadota bacterium]|nr:MTH1187 family thiamine-binding protein [Armatimonadota bacterium]
MAVVADIALIPVGTNSPSISRMLADSVKVLERFDLTYDVTSTGTNVEGDLDTILQAVKAMEEVPFQEGADRVVILLKLDDRRDKAISLDYEEQSLEEKL